MVVRACLKCFSLNLRSRTLSDGLVPGRTEMSDIRICRDCGHSGVPIMFDSRAEYERFLSDREGTAAEVESGKKKRHYL